MRTGTARRGKVSIDEPGRNGGTKMRYKARVGHGVRIVCAFLAAALLLTCCPLKSRAEIIDSRIWKGFVYTGYSSEEYEAKVEGRPVNKSDIRLEIVYYEGPKRELTIPTEIDGMKVVSVRSLKRARNLRTLHIPNGVKIDGALVSAPKLKNITVSKSNKRYSVKNNALLNKKGTVLLDYPGGRSILKIPNSVTRVGSFYQSRFKRIKWGKNVKKIGWNAFSENRGIQTLTIKGKVEVIGSGAFSDCKKLKKVVLGENVRKIEGGAFEDCYKLKSIYIYNRNCKISPPEVYDYGTYGLAFPEQATIYGWKGSTAEKFAEKYNIKFQELKE